MLATALTVVLGTAPVTAFAADVDSTVTEAEQTTPQADTTVKEEVAEPVEYLESNTNICPSVALFLSIQACCAAFVIVNLYTVSETFSSITSCGCPSNHGIS